MLVAVETSSNRGSLAVARNSSQRAEILALENWTNAKSHSELITVALDRALLTAGIGLDQVESLAVGLGPGSFTGIRVGINMVRALSFAKQIPVYGANSLAVLTHPAKERYPHLKVLALVNAFKNSVYFLREGLDSHPRTSNAESLSRALEGNESHLCVGDGFDAYKDVFVPELKARLLRREDVPDQPDALSLAQMVLAKNGPDSRRVEKFDSWKSIKPLYIRDADAEEKLRKAMK